jgi:ribosomal-protein-alanine N-acetyltransferase
MTRSCFMRTTRLGFGIWTPGDLDLARGLWGDPRVTRLIGGPFADDTVRERLAAEIASQEAEGIQYWPLFRLADDVHVGCCGLRPYAPAGRVLELGFHLRFDHWGRGYAREAAEAVMHHAFTVLGVNGLFAGHHPDNAASRRLLDALGFRYTRDELYAPTGLRHPSYAMNRDDFAASPR